MTNQHILEHISEIEDELQKLKLSAIISLESIPASPKKYIVKTTAGLLGKKFPHGTLYETKIRKEWDKRIKRFGL